jgi:tetratricopeptide (TPR) repeat protein
MGIYMNNIGLLYRELSLYDSAEVYLHGALEKKLIHGDKTLVSSTLGNLAILYRDLMRYDLAMEFLHQQLDIAPIWGLQGSCKYLQAYGRNKLPG